MLSPKKVLSKSFVDNHESINEDVAGELIVKAEQKIKEIKEEKAADTKLAAAKEIAKDLNSAYTSALRYEQAKIDFLLEKIAEIQAGLVNPHSGANS
jgi:phage terminase Nu1 subunit (DNA packaging protein)